MDEKDLKDYFKTVGKKLNKKNLKNFLHDIEKASKKEVIVSNDGVIVTLQNRTK